MCTYVYILSLQKSTVHKHGRISRPKTSQTHTQAKEGRLDTALSSWDLQVLGVLGGRQSGITLPSFGGVSGSFPGGLRGIEAKVRFFRLKNCCECMFCASLYVCFVYQNNCF